jgi:hypothetical protein
MKIIKQIVEITFMSGMINDKLVGLIDRKKQIYENGDKRHKLFYRVSEEMPKAIQSRRQPGRHRSGGAVRESHKFISSFSFAFAQLTPGGVYFGNYHCHGQNSLHPL